MRALILATAVGIGLLVSPAIASTSNDTMKACAAAWHAKPAADKANTTYKDYSKACLKDGGPSAMSTTRGANSSQQRMKDCAAKWDAMKAAGATLGQSYEQFSATCLKGGM